jgi:hypothetical protein
MFNRDELKALLLIASSDSFRLYLSGIHFESTPDAVIAVATDGHRMLVLRKTVAHNDIFAPIDGFLTRADADAMVKASGGLKYLSLVADGENVRFGQVSAKLERQGNFPNWRAAVPEKYSGEVAQFNAAYVGDFGRVNKLLGGDAKFTEIAHNGDGAALVNVYGDAFGILMPMHADVPTLKSWVHVKQEMKQAA